MLRLGCGNPAGRRLHSCVARLGGPTVLGRGALRAMAGGP